MPDWSIAQGCVLFGHEPPRLKGKKGKREKGKKGKKGKRGVGRASLDDDAVKADLTDLEGATVSDGFCFYFLFFEFSERWSSPNDVRASERCSAWKAAWGRDDEIGRWKKGADRGRHRWMKADRDRQRNAGLRIRRCFGSLGPNCASGSWSVAMADLDRPAKSYYFSTKQDTDDGSAQGRLRSERRGSGDGPGGLRVRSMRSARSDEAAGLARRSEFPQQQSQSSRA